MNLKRYRDYAIVLLALAVPFWFLRTSMRDPKQASGPDRLIVAVATPVQYAAAMLARGVSNLWGDYIYLVDVKQDNAKLASQNARLRERVRELERHEAKIRDLQRLLDLRASMNVDTVSAQIVAKNVNDSFRVIRVSLDRDWNSVKPNMPVVTADGVVGTTVKGSSSTVDVRLIADAGFGVDVVVERTGARGFVRGLGKLDSYECRVQYVQRVDEVDVGDFLVTSGYGRHFPKGIPVAVVSEVIKKDFGIYQEVRATPTVDLTRVEEVLIVRTEDTELPSPTFPSPAGSGSSAATPIEPLPAGGAR